MREIVRARRASRVLFCACDVDVARLVVPSRDSVAPPKLSRERPIVEPFEPILVDLLVRILGDEARLVSLAYEFERRASQFRLLQEPLRRDQRLDDRAAAVALRYRELVVRDLLKQPRLLELPDDKLARFVAV